MRPPDLLRRSCISRRSAAPRYAFDKAALQQVRDGAADAGLVHARTGGDVLRGAARVLADGRHDAPFRDIELEAPPVDGRQMLAYRGRQAIEAKGHETRQLQ